MREKLGSLCDAEDMGQEMMLRAWQHADTFKGQSSLRTWLYEIATNACLDVLKKRPARTLPVWTPCSSPPLASRRTCPSEPGSKAHPRDVPGTGGENNMYWGS